MGGALGGRARPERPGKVGLSLGCEGHEGIPQGCGLLGQRRDRACTVRRFIRVEALLDGRAAVLPQARAGASLCAVAVIAFGVPRRAFIHRKQAPKARWEWGKVRAARRRADGDARRPRAHPPRQHRATRHLVLGTPPQPAPEVFHARPPGHVRADLAEDDQGGAFCDALDGRQGDAGQARERRASLAAGFVGLCVAVGLGGGKGRPAL